MFARRYEIIGRQFETDRSSFKLLYSVFVVRARFVYDDDGLRVFFIHDSALRRTVGMVRVIVPFPFPEKLQK